MGKRTAVSVKVTDIEKRRVPSKHYVYVMRVTWSDGSSHTVYRRYSRFFDFQNELLDKFPVEGGENDPAQRIIPFLPGKKFFGRSHVREVAIKRLKPIDEYCQALIKLPAKISECDEVLEFLETESDDLDPIKERHISKKPKGDKISRPKLLEQYVAIADYDPREKGEIRLRTGMNIEVAEKTETGWWFVTAEDEQGWVPSTYLETQDGGEERDRIERPEPGKEEEYVCTQPFTGEDHDELTLERGAIVLVLEKNLQGWWNIRYNGQEGFVPAAYLSRTKPNSRPNSDTQPGITQQGPVQVISSLSEISEFFKPKDDAPKPFSKKSSMKAPPPRSNSLPRGSAPQASSGPRLAKEYVTIESFSDSVGDGISFSAGQSVKVLEKSPNGWWFVEIGEQEGWAPAAYIQQLPETPGAGDNISIEEERMDEEVGPNSAIVQRKSYMSEDTFHADVSNIAGALKAKFESRPESSGRIGSNVQARPSEGPPLPPTKPSAAPDRPQVPPTKPAKPQAPPKVFSNRTSNIVCPQNVNKPLVSPSELKARGSDSTRPASKPSVQHSDDTDNSESTSNRRISTGNPMVNDVTSALKARFENPSNGTTKHVGLSKPVAPPKAAVKPKIKHREPRFWASATFIAENEGEVSLEKGQEVEVNQIDDGGWWFVKVGDQEGWAPATYLEEEMVPDNTAEVGISKLSKMQLDSEREESHPSSPGVNVFGARLKPVQKREDVSPSAVQKGGTVPGKALLPPAQKLGTGKPMTGVKPKPRTPNKGALPLPPPKPS